MGHTPFHGLGWQCPVRIWDLIHRLFKKRPPDTLRGNADSGISQLVLPQVRTSSVVGDNGHREVHFVGVHVWGGADGIVARLQQGQLGEEKCGWHLDGRELLQHLHHCGVLAPFPLLVFLQPL